MTRFNQFASSIFMTDEQRDKLLAQYSTHLELIDSREIPHEYRTGPDLSYYTESAEFYYQLIVDSAPHLKDKRRVATDADREMASTAYNRMVHATWGLIACGAAATPFAIALARSKDRDHREMAANVFCGLRDPERAPQILEEIRKSLATENDHLVIDSLLGALGPLRSREAIPDLARFILDEYEDMDTRDTAATSLGQIVRKRFDKGEENTVDKAKQWLIANGFEPV